VIIRTIGTFAPLPALCGYVFIGTLTDASLCAWRTGPGPVHWGLLGIGGLATLVLIVGLGQIVVKLGLLSSVADNLELNRTPTQPGDLPLGLVRLIFCRARNTVRSPTFISTDTVRSRNATLIGSIRRPDRKESSPIRCCLAWQAVRDAGDDGRAYGGAAPESPRYLTHDDVRGVF
jgi:hypothetical protein